MIAQVLHDFKNSTILVSKILNGQGENNFIMQMKWMNTEELTQMNEGSWKHANTCTNIQLRCVYGKARGN